MLSAAARARARREAERRGISVEKKHKGPIVALFPPQKREDGQKHPQELFDECEADILVYGGSAGGGKTFSILREPTKYVENPGFGCVIFRRTMAQVKAEGGIWDASRRMYPKAKAVANLTERFWVFPSGCKVKFGGLDTEDAKYDYQGTEICLLEFDELNHFTESQFFYLLTRNRSTCGIRPRVRCSVNPSPGWVKRLLAPWVDRKFPTPAKSGEVRWFIREAGQIVWLNEKPERFPCSCLTEGCENCFPPEKSITFIRASVYDNKILLAADPGYVTNLMVQGNTERRQLLDGDWDAKPANLVLDGFQEETHVVPFRKLPENWRSRNVGADFGSINAAEIFVAEDPDNKNLVIFNENWPGFYRTTAAICEEIKQLCGGTPLRGCGGNKTVEQGSVESYKLHGIPMVLPKFRDVALQYRIVNDLFRSGELYVMEHCVKTIEMLNTFTRILGADGLPTDDFDDSEFHLLAALRYICSMLRPPKEKKVIEVKFF